MKKLFIGSTMVKIGKNMKNPCVRNTKIVLKKNKELGKMKRKMNKFGERFKGNSRRRRKKFGQGQGQGQYRSLEMSIVFRVFT